MAGFGAYSEVGKLRRVIVHRPGLEMRRLTPSNAAELVALEPAVVSPMTATSGPTRASERPG